MGPLIWPRLASNLNQYISIRSLNWQLLSIISNGRTSMLDIVKIRKSFILIMDAETQSDDEKWAHLGRILWKGCNFLKQKMLCGVTLELNTTTYHLRHLSRRIDTTQKNSLNFLNFFNLTVIMSIQIIYRFKLTSFCERKFILCVLSHISGIRYERYFTTWFRNLLSRGLHWAWFRFYH